MKAMAVIKLRPELVVLGFGSLTFIHLWIQQTKHFHVRRSYKIPDLFQSAFRKKQKTKIHYEIIFYKLVAL